MYKDFNGNEVVLKDVISSIKDIGQYNIYVGTDSHIHRYKKKIAYATCIVLHKVGKGGRILVKKVWDDMVRSLRERLMKETWKSIEVAFELSSHLPEDMDITVHLDINPDKKYKSAKHLEDLVGMVVGQGFKCKFKPDAWAAQSVADYFTK